MQNNTNNNTNNNENNDMLMDIEDNLDCPNIMKNDSRNYSHYPKF